MFIKQKKFNNDFFSKKVIILIINLFLKMSNIIAFFIVILVYLIPQPLSALTANPVWLVSQYFQANSAEIKPDFSTTFNSSNPINISFAFQKTYTQIPQLAYGLRDYSGNDSLTTQNFAIVREELTQTSFRVYTFIDGKTNIRIMTIQYLAVDRSFPYHLNTFNDVPVNYSNALSNITIAAGGSTTARQYRNYFNYTDLATSIGSNHTVFGTNLAKCDVMLYLCAIFNSASGTSISINFQVTMQITAIDQFYIDVLVSPNYSLDLLRFSLVAMDKQDIQRSGKFTIVSYYTVLLGSTTNYISIPHEFFSGTLIGMVDYGAPGSKYGLEFHWMFDPTNDRIIVNQSVLPSGYSGAWGGLTQYRLAVFYMKTWQCQYPTIYFNLTTNLCYDFCDYYTYANSTAAACQPCTFGCYTCANGPLSDCTSCNVNDNRQLVNGTCQCMSGYYPDPLGTYLCVPCRSISTNCTICEKTALSIFNCTQCDSGYTQNSSNGCSLCSSFMTNCLTCSSQTNCTTCDNSVNYYLNTTSLQCELCTLTGCLTCNDLTSCSVCNTSSDYFINTTTQHCQLCTQSGCLSCLTLTTCSSCDQSALYFFNNSISQCYLCDASINLFVNSSSTMCEQCTLTGCLNCSSLTACSSCDQSVLYFLNTSNNQCYYCNTSLNFFVNSSSTLCEQCLLSQCLLCENLTSCTTCNELSGYLVNTTTKQCELCTLAGCLTCQTLTTCKTCDSANNYGLSPDGTCKQCPFTCQCDGYVLPKYINSTNGQQYCSTLCGDGLVRNFEQCDDGNTVNGDGCSSTCQIEQGWSCNSDPSYTCCNLDNTQLILSIDKILKVPNKNSMTLILSVNPLLPILTPENMQKYVKLTVTGLPLYNELRVSKSGQILEVTYDYNQSINGKNGSIGFEISFSQAGAPSCVIRATKSITILAKSSNNLPFMFYTDDQLAKKEEVQKSANALEIITYVIFFISMIPAKIIGLQLIGVMQLAYFALAQQDNVNLLLEPFIKMNEINGFNPDWINEKEQLPDKVSQLGIKALFLNNCNVMLLIILAEVLFSGILYLMGHFLSSVSQKLSSVSKYLIKEGLLTLMMFNAFNIAFGVGIHFQYADKNDQSYTLSSVASILASGLIFVICILLMFAEAKQFGEFKDKFKPNLMCQLYFVFSLAYRYALGYYIAVKNEYILSTLIVIGFSILFLLYNFVNLPFKDAYHNYRANICHLAQLVILVVSNYYESMTLNVPLQEKAYRFSPAEIEIGSIYFAVGFSVICLVIDMYKFIRSKCTKDKSNSLSDSQNKRLTSIQNAYNLSAESIEMNQPHTLNESQMYGIDYNKK